MPLSFDWLREIKPEIKALDSIPLTGSPPFPWEELAAKLKQTFDCKDLTIHPQGLTWCSKEELTKDLAHPLSVLTFTIPSLRGMAHWLMPEEEISLLQSLILTKEGHSPAHLGDKNFIDNFYKFTVQEVLYALSQTSYNKALIPLFHDEKNLPVEDSLCLDILFAIHGRSLKGRLVISPALRKELANYFSERNTLFSEDLAKKISVPLHLEIGRTEFSLAEWRELAVGDFILFDRCLLNPDGSTGHLMMTIHGKPAFSGELIEGRIQILEFPLIHEVNTVMAKDHEDDEDEDLDDLDFDDEDFDEFDEELFEDLDEEEEEDLSEEEEAETPPAPSKAPPKKGSEENGQEKKSEVEPSGTSPLSPDQIPVTVVVELGSIALPMQKVLQLEVGNILDIAVRPDNGVELTINGTLAGKGELVRIGENLGVRIVELGS